MLFKKLLGQCPVCNTSISTFSNLEGRETINPERFKDSDIGFIHCGSCISALAWDNKTPLHVASPEEVREVIKEVGQDGYEAIVRMVIEHSKVKTMLQN